MKQNLLTVLLLFTCYVNAQWFSWEARIGMSGNELVSFSAEMDNKKFTPTSLEVYYNGREEKLSTVWNHYPENAACEIRTGLSFNSFLDHVNANKENGFILTDISVYNVNGVITYGAVFSYDPNTPWWWKDVEGQFLKAEIDSFSSKGFKLVDINGYVMNGKRYYSCLWKKFTTTPWQYIFGYNQQDFVNALTDKGNNGYIPSKVDVFVDNGVPVYSAFFTYINNETAMVSYNIAEINVQQLVDENVNKGYAITDISVYVLDSVPLYTIVFSKVKQQNIHQAPVINDYSTPSVGTARYLEIPPVEQQTQVWCWLATGEMIFKYFNVANANPNGNYQCGIIGSLNFVSPYCSSECFHGSCIVPSGSNYNTARMLRDYAWSQHKAFGCTEGKELSFDLVRQNINMGQPILAGTSYNRRSYYEGSEHVVVITGYETGPDGNYLIVNDPFPYPAYLNPFINEGGKQLQANQYKISYSGFTNRIFWNWSLYNISVN